MVKDLVMEVTNTLPDDATFDDIIEAIYMRLRIDEGIKDAQTNNGLSTLQLLEELKEWK